MKRKKVSNSIRFHKIKDKSSHEWLYSQLLLYYPFQLESVDFKEALVDENVCEDMFLYPANPDLISEYDDKIQNSDFIKVRRKVMQSLDDVEEARERVAVLNTERIGEEIGAENAQDNEECVEIWAVHYYFLNYCYWVSKKLVSLDVNIILHIACLPN